MSPGTPEVKIIKQRVNKARLIEQTVLLIMIAELAERGRDRQGIGAHFYSGHYLESGSAVYQTEAGKKYRPETDLKA